ncbi:MAG: thiamine-phosphate synthase family protein [Halobacteriaceae archaeon]
MALTLPSEIVADRFLPAVRASLAVALSDRGLTQQAVADHLGVTQAAVSNYLRGEAAAGDDRFREHPRTRETVDRVADGLAAGTMDEYEALAAVLELVWEFEDRGPICAAHEEAMPALQGLGCDLCVRGFDADLAVERSLLSNVRRAARRLETAPGAASLVPNVGTNVAMALPDATDATDVAAIPGRIHATRDRVTVPSRPEFGASEHVAGAVLTAMAVDPAVRGALDVVTDDRLLDAARDRGLDPLAFDASYEGRRDRLRTRFESRGEVPAVAYHEGAYGVEPVTYVFGETAVDATDRALALLDATR